MLLGDTKKLNQMASDFIYNRFTIQILQSLCLLYEHQVIHCDLKPEVKIKKNKRKKNI